MSHTRTLLAVAVAGCLLVTTGFAGVDLEEDARALIERATLRIDPGRHAAPLRGIAAARNGAFLATGAEDRTIRLWNVQTGELLRTLRPPSTADGDEGKIYAVAVSPDARLVAAAGITSFFDDRAQRGSSVYLFDANSGELVRRLPGPAHTQRTHRIERLVFSSDGKRLAATRGYDMSVGLYDTASGTPINNAIAQGSYSIDADFDAAGNLLLCRPGGIALFDSTLRPLASLSGIGQLARARFSPDGKQVALLYSDGRLELRRPADLKLLRALSVGPDQLKLTTATALSFAMDGKSLVLAGQTPTVAEPQGLLRRFFLTGKAAVRDTPLKAPSITDLSALPSGAMAFAASDGSWGVLFADGTATAYEGTLALGAAPESLLVDMSGEELELRFGTAKENKLRFSVSTLTMGVAAPKDVRLRPPIFEAPTPHRITGWQHSPPVLLNHSTLMGSSEDPAALAIAPGKESFLIGTARNLFGYRFVRAAGDGCPHQGLAQSQLLPPCFIRGVPAPVRALNYSGDGRYAVALIADGTVRWYDARDGSERLGLYARPGDARWLLFRPDGLYAASPGGAELAGFLLNPLDERAPDFLPLSRLKRNFERPEIVAATLRGDTAAPTPHAGLRREELPPLVNVLSPSDGATFSETSLAVKIAVRPLSGQPVTALRVRIDGRPVAVAQPRGIFSMADSEPKAAGKDESGAPGLVLNVPVPPRDCVLAVYAESTDSAGPPTLVRLHWRDPQSAHASQTATTDGTHTAKESPKIGTLRLLAIGVDDYVRPELRLRYPGKDARDLAALLKRQTGPGRLYEAVDTRVLTGRDATKAAILEGLDWLEHRAAALDTSLLFFAGHGINDPTTGDYYFLPADADPTSTLRSMLPASTIQQVLASLQGRVVLFLDTCHSGNVLGHPGRRARGLRPLNRAIAELSSVESGVVVMTAATADQASLEDTAWQNGAFAKALLEGLGGRADLRRTGRVTVNMLDLYVSERVRELTDGNQTPATAKPITIADFPLVLSR